MKKILWAIAILAALIAAWLAFRAERADAPVTDLVGLSEGDESEATATGTIESFVRDNIGVLSPVKSVLGGTFYVTKIEAHGGAGTVWYEDGHIAVTADFAYSIDENGRPSVDSFSVQK